MKENLQKDVATDFYNMTLEIHKNDPKGFDILVYIPYYLISVCRSNEQRKL